MAKKSLRVLVFYDKRTGYLIAQCLEHDIIAQALDLDELILRLESTIKAEIRNSKTNSLSEIPPAPNYLIREWEDHGYRFEPKRPFESLEFQPALCA